MIFEYNPRYSKLHNTYDRIEQTWNQKFIRKIFNGKVERSIRILHKFQALCWFTFHFLKITHKFLIMTFDENELQNDICKRSHNLQLHGHLRNRFSRFHYNLLQCSMSIVYHRTDVRVWHRIILSWTFHVHSENATTMQSIVDIPYIYRVSTDFISEFLSEWNWKFHFNHVNSIHSVLLQISSRSNVF